MKGLRPFITAVKPSSRPPQVDCQAGDKLVIAFTAKETDMLRADVNRHIVRVLVFHAFKNRPRSRHARRSFILDIAVSREFASN